MINNHNDVDDIEDIVKVEDLQPIDRYNNKKDVLLRVRKRNNNNSTVNGNDEIKENGNHQSVSINIKFILFFSWKSF